MTLLTYTAELKELNLKKRMQITFERPEQANKRIKLLLKTNKTESPVKYKDFTVQTTATKLQK